MTGGDDAVVSRALRDPSAPPPAIDAARMVAAASQHRVLVLLGALLRNARTIDAWPAPFNDAFTNAERKAAAIDAVRHRELESILREAAAAGLRVLVFKGAALAYTHYPAPHVRVRADADLLVAADAVAPLEAMLQQRGYVKPPETSGQLVSYQSHCCRMDRFGVAHALDMHWKVSNLQVLADRFQFDELWARRRPVRALGPSAFTVDDVAALLLALVHRAGHHPGSRNLLWLYHLHLLASVMTDDGLREVLQIASARGLTDIAAEGLGLAHDTYATRALAPVVDTLRAVSAERSDVVPTPQRTTQAGMLRLDLAALPSWQAKAQLVREHLFPPPGYIRARYGIRSNVLLPAMYIWRALAGAPKWLFGDAGD